MSTRVLPDPAGAITRAGPAPWATAASWSGASSAVGGRVGGGATARRPSSTDVGGGRRRRRSTHVRADARGPPSTHAGRPVGQHGRRPGRPGSPRAPEPLGLAGPPPDRLAVAGVVGVGPDEEVQPVQPGLEPGARPSRARPPRPGARGTGPGRRPASTTTGSALRPGPVQPAHARRRARPGWRRRSGPRARPRHGRRHGPAVAHDDHAAAERGGTGHGHARGPVAHGRRGGFVPLPRTRSPIRRPGTTRDARLRGDVASGHGRLGHPASSGEAGALWSDHQSNRSNRSQPAADDDGVRPRSDRSSAGRWRTRSGSGSTDSIRSGELQAGTAAAGRAPAVRAVRGGPDVGPGGHPGAGVGRLPGAPGQPSVRRRAPAGGRPQRRRSQAHRCPRAVRGPPGHRAAARRAGRASGRRRAQRDRISEHRRRLSPRPAPRRVPRGSTGPSTRRSPSACGNSAAERGVRQGARTPCSSRRRSRRCSSRRPNRAEVSALIASAGRQHQAIAAAIRCRATRWPWSPRPRTTWPTSSSAC